jgi:hypothetical protein
MTGESVSMKGAEAEWTDSSQLRGLCANCERDHSGECDALDS